MPGPQPETGETGYQEIKLLPPELPDGRIDGMTAPELCTRKAATFLGCPKTCARQKCRTEGECQGAGRDRTGCDSRQWDADAAALARHLLRFWTWVVERRVAWLVQSLKRTEDDGWEKFQRVIYTHAVHLAQAVLARRRDIKLSVEELEDMGRQLKEDFRLRRYGPGPKPGPKPKV